MAKANKNWAFSYSKATSTCQLGAAKLKDIGPCTDSTIQIYVLEYNPTNAVYQPQQKSESEATSACSVKFTDFSDSQNFVNAIEEFNEINPVSSISMH